MLKKSSVNIAKDRLKQLITVDRVMCLPESYENLTRELYNVISKYITFTEDNFHIKIERKRISIYFTGEDL